MMNMHYLSITYQVIITNRIIHYIFFFLEMYLLLLQFLEIYCNNFKSYITEDVISFTPLTKIMLIINKLPIIIKNLIYIIIMAFSIIINYILNFFRIKINKFIGIIINVNELLLNRILSLFMFNYLFSFQGINFLINFIITLPYIFILIIHFYKNHLFFFFPNLINYPFDSFSMIIDLHFLGIKIFISISGFTLNEKMSKFFFILSISIFFILLFYLTYIMIYKSYYLMNNCYLNKVRYSIILTICLIFLFVIIIGAEDTFTTYTAVCYINILLLCILFTSYYYDPYEFSKFDKDDNIDNAYFYFFIVNRDKNKYLLLDEKIEKHLSRCTRCNLCKKYKNYKLGNKNEEIDIYNIIYDGKDTSLNMMNNLVKGLRKNGRNGLINNSYFLINIIYIYHLAINQRNHNIMLNSELLYDIINSENKQFLEEYKICLNRIIYTNKFLIKAKKLINSFYEILDEKKIDKRTQRFFKFGELLNELKYKEIKSNINNNIGNNIGNNIEKLPNCNNLITICSLFYEELYNESLSNSGIYIRESPNLLEDLINNNYKTSKQITLKIDLQYFKVIIIRAGGHLNEYENTNLFDFFPPIFKNRQITEMRNILLNSNNNIQMNSEKDKNNKSKKNEKQHIRFKFIIEEKEDNNIFYRILKLKLSYILMNNINIIIYLNGVYTIDNDIIVTEEKKEVEILLNFGNKEQMIMTKNDNIFIKKNKNEKYLGNKKLIKDSNYKTNCKKYNVYHLLSSIPKKKSSYTKIDKNLNKSQMNDEQDDKTNYDNSNKILLFNDLASQASSTTSSVSANKLISYNRGNKQIKSNGDITKVFKIGKFALLISVLVLFISIIIESIFLINFHKKLKNKNEFYLILQDYKAIANNLFYSILSLTCIGNSTNSYYCINFMDKITKEEMEEYVNNLKYNSKDTSEIIENTNYIYNQNLSDNITNEEITDIILSYFVDFNRILFIQNTISSKILKNVLKTIIQNLSMFEKDEYINNFQKNVSIYKINQNISSEKVLLSLKHETLTFSDFLLLMTSRFGILSRSYSDIFNPIYILNKTGEEVFNNIYNKEKLNTYQENLYLLILDNRVFCMNLDIAISDLGIRNYYLKKKLRTLLFLIINFNMFLFIVILILMIGYVLIYYFIIFKILKTIYFNLDEKMGDISINNIIKKKIDNLKLLFKFYENDINNTIDDLNNIYNNYRESYNLKIKEESKLFKKEGKSELENKNKKYNFMEIFKILKNYKLLEYSGRKNIYLYSLLFIIIICIISYSIPMITWILFFKKDEIVIDWVVNCEQLFSSTYRLMTSFYLMIFNNHTLDDISEAFGLKDIISQSYADLMLLYQAGRHLKSIGNLMVFTEKNINYDCYEFYEKMDNYLFLKIKNNFLNKENQFLYTMYFFCNRSNVMQYKNYKSIYLKLFNQIKIKMENYNNINYNNIIKFINDIDIIRIEIIFLMTYAYLFDFMYRNIQSSIRTMMDKIGNNIILTCYTFLSVLIFLIFFIFFVFIRNVNNDSKKFIQIRKVFKVCNIND